ncbi:MAG: hypothetical protein JRI25_29155 [Deltaproteobacteria bacterium]|nr:hypothetical protein [Deltaproteobacteria bacterium]
MEEKAEQLAAGFRAMGLNADDASSFARAQVSRGKPQALRVLFQMALFSLDESGKPSQAVESLGETLDGYDPAGPESVFSSQGG